MLHPSTRKLIDRLAEMTANRQLDWKTGDTGHPECTRADYTIVLQSDPTEFRIRSSDGRDVERVEEAELAETDAYPAISYLDIFRGMRSEAQRHADEQSTAQQSVVPIFEADRPDLETALTALKRARGIKLVKQDGTRIDRTGARLVYPGRGPNDDGN